MNDQLYRLLTDRKQAAVPGKGFAAAGANLVKSKLPQLAGPEGATAGKLKEKSLLDLLKHALSTRTGKGLAGAAGVGAVGTAAYAAGGSKEKPPVDNSKAIPEVSNPAESGGGFDISKFLSDNSTALGAGGAAATVGGLGGYLGTNDEKKRLRNALIAAVLTGGAGAAAGHYIPQFMGKTGNAHTGLSPAAMTLLTN